jgi:hypothetical protein
MKRLFGLLLVVLAVLSFSFGCNGADEITGPGAPGPGGPGHKVFQPVEPTPVPRLAPRPDPGEKHPRPDRPCGKDTNNC